MSEAMFEGKGEAHRFLTWSEHLKAYFRRENITNSVTQARLAERTFRGKVARWWNAHNDRHPGHLLSFARLLELLRTEMVSAADLSAACLQWSNLQYEGRPDAFLKELDRLTDTYPLDRAALIQLATRPFPPEFAGQVRRRFPRSTRNDLSSAANDDQQLHKDTHQNDKTLSITGPAPGPLF